MLLKAVNTKDTFHTTLIIDYNYLIKTKPKFSCSIQKIFDFDIGSMMADGCFSRQISTRCQIVLLLECEKPSSITVREPGQ